MRIYPARNSKMYDRFFSSGKNGLNKIIYKVLYTSEVLEYASKKEQLPSQTEQGLVKQNSSQTLLRKSESQPMTATQKERVQSASGPRNQAKAAPRQAFAPKSQTLSSSPQPPSNAPKAPQSKVMITGDDILIEYVSRVTNHLAKMREEHIDRSVASRIELFITHYVWHQPDQLNPQSSD